MVECCGVNGCVMTDGGVEMTVVRLPPVVCSDGKLNERTYWLL